MYFEGNPVFVFFYSGKEVSRDANKRLICRKGEKKAGIRADSYKKYKKRKESKFLL